jgi:integrase
VGGPFAPFAEGLRRDLAGQGYPLDTVGDHVHLLANLSGWLSGQGLTAAGLMSGVAERFLADRRAVGRRVGVSGRALTPTLGYLRQRGVAPSHTAVSPATPLDVLMAGYRHYLQGQRGLSAGTVTHHLRCARVFVIWLPELVGQSLPALSAGQVADYVLGWTAGPGRRRGHGDPARAAFAAAVPARRGHVRWPLAAPVPAGRRRPASVGAPRAASGAHVRAVLADCDRDSAAGRRDYAILLTMARLALRAGEVAHLRLDESNWRAGEVRVHGKGGRLDVLPLPADVGEAMAAYLLHARPATAPVRHDEGPVYRPGRVVDYRAGGMRLRTGRRAAVQATSLRRATVSGYTTSRCIGFTYVVDQRVDSFVVVPAHPLGPSANPPATSACPRGSARTTGCSSPSSCHQSSGSLSEPYGRTSGPSTSHLDSFPDLWNTERLPR